MAKKVVGMIKLQIPAGKATPAPPVGPALGQHQVNIMDFCKAFNARTAKQEGLIIPVVITVYQNRSYSFITKTPPAAVLLKRAAAVTWWMTCSTTVVVIITVFFFGFYLYGLDVAMSYLAAALTRMSASAKKFDIAGVREADLALVAAVSGGDT